MKKKKQYLPEEVDIMGMTFKVGPLEVDLKDKTGLARTMMLTQTIEINPELHPDTQEKTLFHEVAEVILNYMNAGFPGKPLEYHLYHAPDEAMDQFSTFSHILWGTWKKIMKEIK